MGDFCVTARVLVRSGDLLTSALVYVFVQEWLGKIWMSKPFSKNSFGTCTHKPTNVEVYCLLLCLKWECPQDELKWLKPKQKMTLIILFICEVHSPIYTPDRPPCSVTIIRRDLSQAHPSVQWKHCEAQQQNRNKWISHCPEWYAVAKAELR